MFQGLIPKLKYFWYFVLGIEIKPEMLEINLKLELNQMITIRIENMRIEFKYGV